MQEALDALESRIAQLRSAIRTALAARDDDRVRELRAELRKTERSWDALVTPADRPEEDRQGLASLLPAREQVHQALTLLGVPAAPKLIGAAHSAFFGGELTASRLASLRRDEMRSYHAAPGARPYYLCPALTSDLLSPARGRPGPGLSGSPALPGLLRRSPPRSRFPPGEPGRRQGCSWRSAAAAAAPPGSPRRRR